MYLSIWLAGLVAVPLLATGCSTSLPPPAAALRVVILVSNVADMGDAEAHEAKNNLWEVAPPFHVFRSHGFDVQFASPQGGKVPFFMDPVGISMYAIRYEGFLDAANASVQPRTIAAEDVDAVFIGGGSGPLFDADMQQLIADVYGRGGVVGGCGHGPGSFADVRLPDGSYLVAGKRVAGFPNTTERAKPWAKGGTLLPFLVEDRLRRNGAHFVGKEDLSDKHAVVVDARLVTAMFLPSAALVAEEMARLIMDRRAGSRGRKRACATGSVSRSPGEWHQPPGSCPVKRGVAVGTTAVLSNVRQTTGQRRGVRRP